MVGGAAGLGGVVETILEGTRLFDMTSPHLFMYRNLWEDQRQVV